MQKPFYKSIVVPESAIRKAHLLVSRETLCPCCGQKREMMPDESVCHICEDEDYTRQDIMGEDFGWRR